MDWELILERNDDLVSSSSAKLPFLVVNCDLASFPGKNPSCDSKKKIIHKEFQLFLGYKICLRFSCLIYFMI